MGPTILFVCTGNLCRSPMAEGLLRHHLEEHGQAGDFNVRSAGTWAVEGSPASVNSVRTMLEWNINLSEHAAHLLTMEDVKEASLVLVMEKTHRDDIVRLLPEEAYKIHLLSEMVGLRDAVEDPYGEDMEAYRDTAGHIAELIEQGYERILRLSKRNSVGESKG